MNHNAVLEDINDDMHLEAEKYVDDLTVLETVRKEVPFLIEDQNTPVAKLSRARATERSVEILDDTCKRKNLKLKKRRPKY